MEARLLSPVDRDVMSQTVGSAGGSVSGQREDRTLPDEVRSGIVLI
jgi:hypothetical protein